jgi:hypothetical protein
MLRTLLGICVGASVIVLWATRRATPRHSSPPHAEPASSKPKHDGETRASRCEAPPLAPEFGSIPPLEEEAGPTVIPSQESAPFSVLEHPSEVAAATPEVPDVEVLSATEPEPASEPRDVEASIPGAVQSPDIPDAYVDLLMRFARYEAHPKDHTWYAHVPGVLGPWANEPSRTEAEQALRRRLRAWAEHQLAAGQVLPWFDDFSPHLPKHGATDHREQENA